MQRGSASSAASMKPKDSRRPCSRPAAAPAPPPLHQRPLPRLRPPPPCPHPLAALPPAASWRRAEHHRHRCRRRQPPHGRWRALNPCRSSPPWPRPRHHCRPPPPEHACWCALQRNKCAILREDPVESESANASGPNLMRASGSKKPSEKARYLSQKVGFAQERSMARTPSAFLSAASGRTKRSPGLPSGSTHHSALRVWLS